MYHMDETETISLNTITFNILQKLKVTIVIFK